MRNEEKGEGRGGSNSSNKNKLKTGSGSNKDSNNNTMKASGAKIFIGGLSWETTTEKMLEHFKKYGEIIDSVIMKDRGTGHPRGFGFVTYSDPSVVDSVMRDTHTLDGRTVEVKRSIPRESMDLLKGPKTKKLFVGGLPTSVSEEEFKNYFKSYGSVVEAQIMQDHSTGRSRGFGFVTFDSEQTVEDILTQGKTHEFDGKEVEIKKAEPKNAMQDSRSSRSGSGRGGYGVGQEDYGYSDGYGGYIGKTTLASAVIAKLDLTHYSYSGIEIHVDRSRNNITSMQRQILKDAFPAYTSRRNLKMRDSAEGRDHLTIAFQAKENKPLFLFIDNALRAEDLQELLPSRLTDLPKRSRIVVTTRNLGVTDMLMHAGLERRDYSVGTLPDNDALKILFKDDNNRGRENMKKTLQICDGIPLVLQIVGARLRKQNYMVERCTQIFEALETGEDIKGENLSQRLVTSVYSELETSTREAFLDICCFFANWDRRDVEYIVGADEVKLLLEVALMKTSNKNQLIVHDIIRAKGRSLSKSNRIMDMQSWQEVAHDDQKLKQIKGVWLGKEEPESGHEVDEKQLHSMKNSLRVLCLESHIQVSRSSQKTTEFRELRFLRLGGDISALWPANLESLERLTVFHGPVYKDGVTLYQLPKKLRVMRATAQSRCEVSKPTKIIQNSSLEELDLRELKSLQKFPEMLDHLIALKILILDKWDKMQELPEQVCGLRSLTRLSICGGESLGHLPKIFGQLSLLQDLVLTSCKQLEELPSNFGDLSSLKHLNLTECVKLKELPFSFGKLRSLEVLNLDSCYKLEIFPSSFWELSSLKELRCSCLELTELPSSIENLTSLRLLDLSYCMKLKSLPSAVGKLRALQVLSLFACVILEEVPY